MSAQGCAAIERSELFGRPSGGIYEGGKPSLVEHASKSGVGLRSDDDDWPIEISLLKAPVPAFAVLARLAIA